MRVLFDHQIFFYQKVGGISKYFFKLINELLKIDNIEILLYQGLYRNIYGFAQNNEGFLFYRGYRRPEWLKLWKLWKLIDFFQKGRLKKIIKSYQVDVYHPTYYYFNYPASKPRIVLTVHDMIHELFPQYFPSAKEEIGEKEKAIKMADALIAVSQNTKKDLMEIYKVNPEKVFVVYHGVDAPPNLPTERKLILSAKLPKPYILYVGSRKLYKNFDCLIKSFKNPAMQGFGLVCAGGGPFTREEELKLSKSGIAEERILQISGDDSTLYELYRNAFCFVFPSLYEGFGLPILEAMFAGCPVVASNRSCFPEVGGDVALYFDPSNPEELAYFILRLDSESYRNSKIAAGLQRAGEFTWAKTARETLEVYKFAKESC